MWVVTVEAFGQEIRLAPSTLADAVRFATNRGDVVRIAQVSR